MTCSPGGLHCPLDRGKPQSLMGSGQAGPLCPMPPPPSPLLTESAIQLNLYLLSSTHFPKRKSEVLWSLNLKSVRKCFFVSFGFLLCPKVERWVHGLHDRLVCSEALDLRGIFEAQLLGFLLDFPSFHLKFGFAFYVLYVSCSVSSRLSFTSHYSGAGGHSDRCISLDLGAKCIYMSSLPWDNTV